MSETVSERATQRLGFPKGFSWGVSTSSYQIEGAASEGGRGPSIWDTFCKTPGRVFHGDTGDIACDHYHRLEEDLDLLAKLGVDTYRFSIAWPRIQPNGVGPANEAGLEFYRKLMDGLEARGIAPVPTLYHWDLPQALQDRGGWVNRDVVEWFSDYARILAEAFRHRVRMWTTINEPWVVAYLGYALPIFAPGAADGGQGAATHHHLLLAHAAAMEVIRNLDGEAKVGIALNMMHIYPASDDPEDMKAAELADAQLNASFLEPLFNGRYPQMMSSVHPSWAAGKGLVREGDLERIRAPVDFLSINTYQPRYVCAPSRVAAARSRGFTGGEPVPYTFGLPFVDIEPAGIQKTDFGWMIEPKGLRDLLLRLSSQVPGVPLYISENGAAFSDYSDPNGRVVDSERVAYLEGHLRAAHEALSRGVDLRGYWVWSLLDNFEWASGYSKRFGLVYVDFPTGTRIPKDSFLWFRDVIRSGGLPGSISASHE
jgi:beta-glucosidase